MRSTRVLFQPIVTVELPSGRIDIDWSSSEISAIDSDGGDIDPPENDEGDSEAGRLLDVVLGPLHGDDPALTVNSLRRLADYIEAQS